MNPWRAGRLNDGTAWHIVDEDATEQLPGGTMASLCGRTMPRLSTAFVWPRHDGRYCRSCLRKLGYGLDAATALHVAWLAACGQNDGKD